MHVPFTQADTKLHDQMIETISAVKDAWSCVFSSALSALCKGSKCFTSKCFAGQYIGCIEQDNQEVQASMQLRSGCSTKQTLLSQVSTVESAVNAASITYLAPS